MAVATLIDLTVLETAVNSLRSITEWTPQNEELATSSLNVFNAILVQSDAYKLRFANSGALEQISRLMLMPLPITSPVTLTAPEAFIIGCCNIMTVFNNFQSQSSQIQILLNTVKSSYRAFQFCFIFALQNLLVDEITWTPRPGLPSQPLVEALISCLGTAPFGANPIGAVGIYYYCSYRVDYLAILACTLFCKNVDPATNSVIVANGALRILQFFALAALVSTMVDTGPFVGPLGPYELPDYSILPMYAPPFVQPAKPPTVEDFQARPIAEPIISQIIYILENLMLPIELCTIAFNSLVLMLSQSTYSTWTNSAPNLLIGPTQLLAAINRQFNNDYIDFIENGPSGPHEGPLSAMVQSASMFLKVLSLSAAASDPMTEANAQESIQMSTYFLGLVCSSLVNVNVSIYTSEIQNIKLLQQSLITILLNVCESWRPIVALLTNPTFLANDTLSPYTIGSRSVNMLSPMTMLGVYVSGGLNMQDSPEEPQEGSGLHHLFAYDPTLINSLFSLVITAVPVFSAGFNSAIPDPAYPDGYTGPPYTVPYNVTVPLALPTGPYSVPQVPYVGSVWFYAVAYVGLNTMSFDSPVACDAAACICQFIRYFCVLNVYYKKWFLFWNAIPLVSKLLQSTNIQVLIQAQNTLAELAS